MNILPDAIHAAHGVNIESEKLTCASCNRSYMGSFCPYCRWWNHRLSRSGIRAKSPPNITTSTNQNHSPLPVPPIHHSPCNALDTNVADTTSLSNSSFRGFSPQSSFQQSIPCKSVNQVIDQVSEVPQTGSSPSLVFNEDLPDMLSGIALTENTGNRQESPDMFTSLQSTTMTEWQCGQDFPDQPFRPQSTSTPTSPDRPYQKAAMFQALLKALSDVDLFMNDPDETTELKHAVYAYIDNFLWSWRNHVFAKDLRGGDDAVSITRNVVSNGSVEVNSESNLMEADNNSAANRLSEMEDNLPTVVNSFVNELPSETLSQHSEAPIRSTPSPLGSIVDGAHEIVTNDLQNAADIVSNDRIPLQTVTENTRSCTKCNFRFRNTKPSTIQEHMRSHEPRIGCDKCGKSVKRNCMKKHKENCKSVVVARRICTTCGKGFASAKTFTRHKNRH